MKKKGGLSLAVLSAAALLVLGCQPLANIGEKWHPSGQRYIKLAISVPPQARSIAVADYQVTGLEIEVLDPNNESVKSIDWDAAEGDNTYMIPVEMPGDYVIKVSHFGQKDGETVEATESAAFNIGAMTITVITVVPGNIGMIQVQGEPAQPVEQDGTLTIHLTGVDAPDGTNVPIGVYPAGFDPGSGDPLSALVAVAGGELEGGNLDSSARISGTETLWIGEGGSSYDVYVWLDMNNNLDTVMFPEPGIDYQLSTFPVTVEINGNVDLYFTGASFVPVP